MCPHANAVNDQFAIGNFEHMKWYAQLFNRLPDIYNRGVPFCDEHLVYQHLLDKNIPTTILHIDYFLNRAR
jgi:hypothetical protein